MNPFRTPPTADPSLPLTIPPHTRRPEPPRKARSVAVERLRADPDHVDEFWSRATTDGTPLIEGHGETRIYTWVHRGEADQVALVTNKLIDDTTYREALLERIPHTDVWAISLELGAGWRGSYALAIDDGRTQPDPDRLAELAPAGRVRCQ